ncbi:nucleotidyl transferase AbiEii/AbiGii toxin family protein [Paenarthrobacter sp. NPDC057355]|uniref:nucleotidyl transferase AbiEii/AbiGii toxin family protein n=1 Tax=Paenarthrobacter sp. NPDC057355 TaxID=3346105 RepID=UPI00364588E5
MTASGIYNQLQALARNRARPFDEILVLYALERFLHRLGSTPYVGDFCLKGGVLLSAHSLRRPTRDIDIQALDFELDVTHVTQVVATVADVVAGDGLSFHTGSLNIEQIRDEDEYTGLRATLPATLHRAKLTIKLDISTGDPIWPAPEQIELPSLLGGSVKMQGHPLVMVLAEKTVTMLQRGTTSTRWRDLLDVVALSDRYPFVAEQVREAARKVAIHRNVELGPLREFLNGYGQVGQSKWAAWRAKNRVEDLCAKDLDDQVERILRFMDPLFDGTAEDHHVWSPDQRSWA